MIDTVTIKLEQPNKLCVSAESGADNTRYTFKLYLDGHLQSSSLSQNSPDYVYWLTDKGDYSVEVEAVGGDGNKTAVMSNTLLFNGLDVAKKSARKESVWQSILAVCSEVWINRSRWWRIAVYDYKVRDKDVRLGGFWRILNPLIQICTYWFVFGIGLRQNTMVGDTPYLIWMLTGLVPWFFISAGIAQGANSIYSKAGMALKLRYPTSTLPLSVIVSNFFDFLITLAILIILMLFYGIWPNLYWLNIIYYLTYSFAFFYSLSLITGTLTMVARDFNYFINSALRLLFYLTPILWSMDNLPAWVQNILKLNPILYIVSGFRDSLLYRTPFWAHTKEALLFWALNAVLFIIGCRMYGNFKNRFLDLI